MQLRLPDSQESRKKGGGGGDVVQACLNPPGFSASCLPPSRQLLASSTSLRDTRGLPGSTPALEPLHPDGKYRHPSTQATETQGFWGSDVQVWDCSAADPSTPQER